MGMGKHQHLIICLAHFHAGTSGRAIQISIKGRSQFRSQRSSLNPKFFKICSMRVNNFSRRRQLPLKRLPAKLQFIRPFRVPAFSNDNQLNHA